MYAQVNAVMCVALGHCCSHAYHAVQGRLCGTADEIEKYTPVGVDYGGPGLTNGVPAPERGSIGEKAGGACGTTAVAVEGDEAKPTIHALTAALFLPANSSCVKLPMPCPSSTKLCMTAV